MHWLADDVAALRACIDSFLDRYQAGSQELLRYVGLASST